MNRYYIFMIFGTFCIGFAPAFVRLCEMSPSLIGFYRCGIAGLAMLAFQLIKGIPLPKNKSFYFMAMLSGLFFASDLFVWHRSVHLIGPGMSTVLGNTQVFYLLLFGMLFYGEKISFVKVATIFGAFLGVILILKGQMGFFSSDSFFYGTMFGLLTGLFYSLYTTSLKKMNDLEFTPKPIQVICFSSLFTAFFLLFFSFTEMDYNRSFLDNWVPLLSLAFVCQVLGWGLITSGLKHIPLSVSGLIILLQPVIAKVSGVFIFDENFSSLEIFGSAILLVSIYIGLTIQNKKLVKLPDASQ